MDKQLCEWKVALERIWSAASPDYHEAARLAVAIAGASEHALLRQAAAQALAILRSASAEDADRITRIAARRRLGVIREVLHSLTSPQFGKRQIAAELPPPSSVIGNCWDYRSAVACPAAKSTAPGSASPRPRTRTPAAPRAHFRSSPP